MTAPWATITFVESGHDHRRQPRFAHRRSTGGLFSPCFRSSFRSLLSLDGGTGNEPLISLRPSLITEHHFESNLNDLAREISRRCAKPSLGIGLEKPGAVRGVLVQLCAF